MGTDAIIGNTRSDASIVVADGTNAREKFRNGIYRLRRDLWRVESELKVLEGRTVGTFDPDRLKPQFSNMFNALVKVMEDFYGLSLSAYDDKVTLKVVNDFSSRFDYARKMGG